MKDWLARNWGWLSDLAIWIGAAAIVVLLIFVMSPLIRDRDITEARCRSLQGEYGGGKCFKEGEEI